MFPVGFLLNEVSRQESSRGVVFVATVAHGGVLPLTLYGVRIPAVFTIEFEYQRSDFFPGWNQSRLFFALTALALRGSLEPGSVLGAAILRVTLELPKWRLSSPRHSVDDARAGPTELVFVCSGIIPGYYPCNKDLCAREHG